MRTVSAADANRYFSRILREVRAGETVVVTSRGQAVAKIERIDDRDIAAVEAMNIERQKAWQEHLARLRSQPTLNLGRITRDEIYDD